jgi:hypothetical protein
MRAGLTFTVMEKDGLQLKLLFLDEFNVHRSTEVQNLCKSLNVHLMFLQALLAYLSLLIYPEIVL